MRIAFLVFNLDGMGGTSRSAITQANALAAADDGAHDVRLLSVTRSADAPHYDVDPRIAVEHLVDVRAAQTDDTGAPRESSLVPARWDAQFTAATDLALEQRLPRLEADVLVTVTPGLLACAITLAPDSVVVVHQEHRSSNDRTSGLEPLLAFAPRADVVALLTPTIEEWLHDRLDALSPPTVVMPNPLPLGFTPRAALESPVIMTAGRLVPEKQFVKLIEAFALIADDLPAWRLRICGDGPARGELVRQVRKRDLWDRVELPGSLPDLAAEWPQASIAALSSRAEGYPLVLQEAMAAGVPAVSFDCPSGPREIIDHEVNGLLVGPQSVPGLAAALRRVATDDDLRHRLGAGALQTARGWEAGALAERWLRIFHDAVARRAGRGRLAARAAAAPSAADSGSVANTGEAEVVSSMEGVTPAQARQHALQTCAVAALRAAPGSWLVIPTHEHPEPVVVLPIGRRAAFLDALAAAPGAPYLSLRDPALHGWHERRGPVAALAADLRHGMTQTLHVEPWPEVGGAPSLLGTDCSVRVELWEPDGAGGLVAPGPNPYATRIGAATLGSLVPADVHGVEVPTVPLMTAPTITECRFPIDVVLTWVDGADPVWDDARERRLAGLGTAEDTAHRREASGRARFLDHGELRYAMRSLHLFAPWVRRIHLVTAGQCPGWLDADHPRINLVDHRELLPPEALPTFNSHAIETALHRIDGLAEHFVYLNDDTMLARPARPERFFSPAGLTAVALSPVTADLGEDADAPPFLQAAWNNRALLVEAFGASLTHTLPHAPYPHRVSVLQALHARFPAALDTTAHAPFRSATDVSTLSSLAQHFGLLTGSAFVQPVDLAYVDLSNADLERRLHGLAAREQDVICLAEHHDHALRPERLEVVLRDFLEGYYPVAAPWELR
ncbi:stealth conserved region 3 domain-containing protein [Nocardioides sp.]|uniref:stealth conserved region 3 domain-containing protein n=1 Tax=Nocardioides sp. TaxID=35761 RepID=UPI003219F637